MDLDMPAFMLLRSPQGYAACGCGPHQGGRRRRPASNRAVPALMNMLASARGSTSAGISNTATGHAFAGSGGMHIYMLVEDGADIPRALAALSDRLWLNRCGWLHVGAAGADFDPLDRLMHRWVRQSGSSSKELPISSRRSCKDRNARLQVIEGQPSTRASFSRRFLQRSAGNSNRSVARNDAALTVKS